MTSIIVSLLKTVEYTKGIRKRSKWAVPITHTRSRTINLSCEVFRFNICHAYRSKNQSVKVVAKEFTN